jgi:hypothetical protein
MTLDPDGDYSVPSKLSHSNVRIAGGRTGSSPIPKHEVNFPPRPPISPESFGHGMRHDRTSA